MENNNKERNAQSFGKKLLKILGEKHEQIREAKFLMGLFLIIISIALFVIVSKK